MVFKKQEILQQMVTRTQDLAFEFSKIFRGRGRLPPDPHNGRGDPLPHPTPSPAFGRVGTQTLVPLNFSAVVALLFSRCPLEKTMTRLPIF